MPGEFPPQQADDQAERLAAAQLAIQEMGLADQASAVVRNTHADGTTHVTDLATAAAECPPFLEQLRTFSTTLGPDFAKQAIGAMAAKPDEIARYEREGNFLVPASRPI